MSEFKVIFKKVATHTSNQPSTTSEDKHALELIAKYGTDPIPNPIVVSKGASQHNSTCKVANSDDNRSQNTKVKSSPTAGAVNSGMPNSTTSITNKGQAKPQAAQAKSINRSFMGSATSINLKGTPKKVGSNTSTTEFKPTGSSVSTGTAYYNQLTAKGFKDVTSVSVYGLRANKEQ